MTVLWLIVWLLNRTPQLYAWNNWLIALVVCAALDFMGGSAHHHYD